MAKFNNVTPKYFCTNLIVVNSVKKQPMLNIVGENLMTKIYSLHTKYKTSQVALE